MTSSSGFSQNHLRAQIKQLISGAKWISSITVPLGYYFCWGKGEEGGYLIGCPVDLKSAKRVLKVQHVQLGHPCCLEVGKGGGNSMSLPHSSSFWTNFWGKISSATSWRALLDPWGKNTGHACFTSFTWGCLLSGFGFIVKLGGLCGCSPLSSASLGFNAGRHLNEPQAVE